MRCSEVVQRSLRLFLRPQSSHWPLLVRRAELSAWNGRNLQLSDTNTRSQASSYSSFSGSRGLGFFRLTEPLLTEASKGQEGEIVQETSMTNTQISLEVHRLHNEITADMKHLKMPSTKNLTLLLQECSTCEDMKLALEVLTRLRSFRASQCKQTMNFNEHVTELVVQSCIRAKAPEYAIRMLWRHNVYGLNPTLGVAHELLAHAKLQGDLLLMQQILKTMVSNGLRPTGKTADIVLRSCKEKGDEILMLKLAKEFRMNGVKLHPSLYDICISSVANTGKIRKVHKIEGWRHRIGLPPTIASAFALAKAYVLQKNPKKAASLIYKHCSERKKFDKYLDMMVRTWPLQLSTKPAKMDKKDFLVEVKNSIACMVESLIEWGYNTDINVDKAFGVGKDAENNVETFEASDQEVALA